MKNYVITINNMFDFVERIVCYCDSLEAALIEQKRLKENNPHLEYKIKLVEKYGNKIN